MIRLFPQAYRELVGHASPHPCSEDTVVADMTIATDLQRMRLLHEQKASRDWDRRRIAMTAPPKNLLSVVLMTIIKYLKYCVISKSEHFSVDLDGMLQIYFFIKRDIFPQFACYRCYNRIALNIKVVAVYS
jgi:hypothetical protein